MAYIKVGGNAKECAVEDKWMKNTSSLSSKRREKEKELPKWVVKKMEEKNQSIDQNLSRARV